MSRITLVQKKWLLALHLVFSGIMLGGAVVVVVLSIAALRTTSPEDLKAYYTMMHLLSNTSVKASSIGTVVTGVLLSVFTHWGLLKHYWIIYKQLLTVFSVGVGVFGFYYWSLNAVSLVSNEGMDVFHNPAFIINNQQLWIGIIFQVISLSSMFIISVFKPWGKRQ
jgi:hypothetical protein